LTGSIRSTWSVSEKIAVFAPIECQRQHDDDGEGRGLEEGAQGVAEIGMTEDTTRFRRYQLSNEFDRNPRIATARPSAPFSVHGYFDEHTGRAVGARISRSGLQFWRGSTG
jgi:hypothetical protein